MKFAVLECLRAGTWRGVVFGSVHIPMRAGNASPMRISPVREFADALAPHFDSAARLAQALRVIVFAMPAIVPGLLVLFAARCTGRRVFDPLSFSLLTCLELRTRNSRSVLANLPRRVRNRGSGAAIIACAVVFAQEAWLILDAVAVHRNDDLRPAAAGVAPAATRRGASREDDKDSSG
jgi:hypothetical protein